MHAVTVTFGLAGMSDEDYRRAAAEVAPAFAGIPGLLVKLWLADAPSGTYGGIYAFETAEAARAYLAPGLFAGAVTSNPHLVDVVVRESPVLAGPTADTAPALLQPDPVR